MFPLVPAYPGCPGSKAVKRSLLLLLLFWGFLVPVAMGLGGRYLGKKVRLQSQTFGENFKVLA